MSVIYEDLVESNITLMHIYGRPKSIGGVKPYICTALIDLKDKDTVKAREWHASTRLKSRTKCISSTDNGKRIYLHRFLLGIEDKNLVVDHKNRRPLNNTRRNLRVASYSQNAMNRKCKSNSAKLKGVTKRNHGYESTIMKDGKYYYLGTFETAELASTAYDKKANELFGSFSLTNKNLGYK